MVTAPSGKPVSVTTRPTRRAPATLVVAAFVRGSVTTKVTGRSPPVLASATVTSPLPLAQTTWALTVGVPGRSQSTVEGLVVVDAVGGHRDGHRAVGEAR